MSRVVVTGGRGSSGRTCRALATRRRSRRGRQPPHRPAREHRGPRGRPALHVHARRRVEGDLAVDGRSTCVLHFASPASPPEYLAMPLETLDVGSIGTRNALDLAHAHDARFVLASTSEVYGDPLVHPQPEDYYGNVNPVGPRAVYDEAKRFAETLTMTYHRLYGLRPASCGSSTRTARACAPPTVGSCRTSSCRRSTASRSPSTATARRPVRSATSTTRCAASSRSPTATSSNR